MNEATITIREVKKDIITVSVKCDQALEGTRIHTLVEAALVEMAKRTKEMNGRVRINSENNIN